MSSLLKIPCPDCGHKRFQKALSAITLGETETPSQLSRIIRPTLCTQDAFGLEYEAGELQRQDMCVVQSLFAHPGFIAGVLRKYQHLFMGSQCRVYQFQTLTSSEQPFVFGTVITDGSHNLIEFCVDTHQKYKRRHVLIQLIRAMCTPSSVAYRLNH